MTSPKTLPSQMETAILECQRTLGKLAEVADLLPANTYRAAQRDALRSLVKRVTNTAMFKLTVTETDKRPLYQTDAQPG